MKKVTKHNIYHFPVVIEHDKDGYFASCPSLQGCYSQGNTYEEALGNIRSAVKLHVEDRRAVREEVNKPSALSLSTVEVTV